MGEAARVTDLTTSFYVQHSMIGVNWIGQEKRGPKQQDMVESALNEAVDQLVPATELQAARWYMNLLGREAELGPLGGNAYHYDFPYKRNDETEEAWARRYQEWGRAGPLPFVWQVLPAESTFPPSFGAIKDEVLSTVLMTWREMEAVFSPKELGGIKPEGASAYDKVTLGIYGNRTHLVYCTLQGGDPRTGVARFVAGANKPTKDNILRTVEHKLGRCPIRINAGMTTALKEPGKHWKSVLFHIRNLCVQLDRRASEAATAAGFDAFPMLKARLQDIGTEGEGASSDINEYLAGDIFEMRAKSGDQGEEDIEPVFQSRFGMHTLQQIEGMAARCAMLSGATEGLGGELGPAGQAAWARSFIVDLARAHFSQLTNSVTASDIDRVEMLERAVAAYGQRVPLNPRGTQKSNIYLDPKELPDWMPYLKAKFKLQVAQNERADFDLGISALERVIAGKLPVPPPLIMSRQMNIEQPEQALEEALAWQYLLSEPAMKAQIDNLLEEADIEIAKGEGMGIDQFMQMAQGQLPPEVIAAVLQGAQGGQAALPPSGGPKMQGNTLGAIQAGAPFRALPGGSKPENREY